MSNVLTGILPFDTDDSSVILRCSLLSAAAVSAPAVGPAGTITGTTHTFDSLLGFKPAASGNSGITFADPTGYADLDKAGQLSFEISREVVCANQSSTNSSGTSPGGVQWSLVWGNGSNTGTIRKVGGSPSNYQLRTHNASDTAGLVYIHSESKSDMVRVTYSWCGGIVRFFIDGMPIDSWSTLPTRNTSWANQFKNISVMSAASGVNPERDGYMRNLIVSSRPVVLPMNALHRIAFLGHSFSATYSVLTVNVDNYHSTIASELRRLAAIRGYDVATNAFGVAGGYWDPALTALDIRDYIAAMLAWHPSELVLYGPTNDVANAGFVAATVDAAIKAALTTIANDARSVNIRRILFLNTPSRLGLNDATWSDTTKANLTAENINMAARPAWWDATFPTHAGKLVVGDLFTAWGELNPTNAVMVGQRSGLYTNLHPAVTGTRLTAELIAARLDF